MTPMLRGASLSMKIFAGRHSKRILCQCHRLSSLSSVSDHVIMDQISPIKIDKILSMSNLNSTSLIKVQGWVRTNRSQKNISFIQLNDGMMMWLGVKHHFLLAMSSSNNVFQCTIIHPHTTQVHMLRLTCRIFTLYTITTSYTSQNRTATNPPLAITITLPSPFISWLQAPTLKEYRQCGPPTQKQQHVTQRQKLHQRMSQM